MTLDFSNTNTLWASILAQTLQRLGLTIAVISPGSRSTPLAIAFVQQAQIETIPVLDERSAAFFALGIARRTHLPVALVCTSGTAGANFYPAVIEAKQSKVPLLVLTADRPPELLHCHAGQAIDQQKLFGSFPNWYAELALPSLDLGMLRYLRQTTLHAWERSQFPAPGPVHLNLPFRDPLAPIPQPAAEALSQTFEPETFFAGIEPRSHQSTNIPDAFSQVFPTWHSCERGIIIAGSTQPQDPEQYCRAISQVSWTLGWPVLAEGLSPLRNYADLNPHLISTYDLILRNQQLAKQLEPEMVIRLGELPISKVLRTWLDTVQPQQWVIDPSSDNFDPLHGQVVHLRTSVEALAQALNTGSHSAAPSQTSSHDYLDLWRSAETKVRHTLDQKLASLDWLFEGKAAWLLSQFLPPQTPLFVANSMPVRDVECFWQPNHAQILPFFNRGASGIDGTLSTALGIAHRHQSSVMLSGDLALLHDTNGFLLRNKFAGHLTIVLINNNGGGIFEMLPISQYDPPFEEFFATPQSLDFAQLCATYKVEYILIQTWEQLVQKLNPLPTRGIRVLELQTNRKADAQWRNTYLERFAAEL